MGTTAGTISELENNFENYPGWSTKGKKHKIYRRDHKRHAGQLKIFDTCVIIVPEEVEEIKRGRKR